MTSDVKKIGALIKETIRPLKDLVEGLKSKVDRQSIYLTSTATNVRSIKEQQSVMNEKIDAQGKRLDALWDQTVKLTEDTTEIKDILNTQTTSLNQTNPELTIP